MVLEEVIKNQAVEVIDLLEKNISYYDYEHKNKCDDFLPIVSQLIKFDKIIFVSPVYWYSLSAPMKTFIDRFSDLLTIEKDLGRKLRGKKTYLISSGSEANCPDCFEKAFQLTCNYLGMNYQGMLYCCFKDDFILSKDNVKLIQQFSKKIFSD